MSTDDKDARQAESGGSLPAVVTIAALHGAGGGIVGPRVAERLGVEFLDRAIPTRVAEQAGLTREAVTAADERPRSGVNRVVSRLARVSNAATASSQDVERLDLEERRIRAEIEEFLARAQHSGGVVVGRGGAVVLRSVPGALHVYLGGDEGDRIDRTMKLDDVDRETARRRVRAHDRARRQYVREAYGVDGDDPGLYHLMIDAPALGTEACVELIAAASRSRTAQSTPTAES
jgi:cytidylate kinase